MPDSNEFSLRERQRAFDNALASQRLEGLEPDARTVAELALVVKGELTFDTVLERLQSANHRR